MLLQPRKHLYKSRQKGRKLLSRFNVKSLIFGQVGLLLRQNLRLNSKSIFRLNLFLKKSAKRSEDTRRKFFVNAFPHLPLTKKIIGARMGKGKGKLNLWFTELAIGHVFIELKNLRKGRSLYFLKQINHKLKGSSKIVYNDHNNSLTNFIGRRNRVSFQSFW